MRVSRKHRNLSFHGMAALLALGVSSGCSFDSSGVGGDGNGGDGGGGAQARCEKDPWEQTPAYFDPCEIPEPTGELVLNEAGTYTYNTTTGELTPPRGTVSKPASKNVSQENGPEIRVISVEKFELVQAATLRVVGEHPLVVASWSTITINNAIDVGSRRVEEVDGSHIGAGANPVMECMTGQGGDGMPDPDSGGGGGGGGFKGVGGDGASGQGGGGGGGNGGMGGAKLDVALNVLRGGCPGGDGGAGDRMNGAGLGGNGGGAVQLAARTLITISSTGSIQASGAGGTGASSDFGGDQDTHRRCGGGGGGSGGMIVLEAPTVDIETDAKLASNGGGGGEGADNGTGNPGSDGILGTTPAPGGSAGDSNGSPGAQGGARSLEDGATAQPNIRGGGGGGGGVGFVVIRGTTRTINSATISPSPTIIEE